MDANPEPNEPKLRLLQWNVDLQKEWEAIYEIEIQGMEIASTSETES